MLFPTVSFAIFFVVVFAVSWLIRSQLTLWKLFILGASWFFYGWWDWRFVGLLALSIGVNYAIGRVVHAVRDPDVGWSAATRSLVGLAVALNLGLLGWFKYYGFFATSLVNSLNDVGIEISPPLLQITLPVGISFFTFQAIAYVVDIGRGRAGPMGLLDFGVFLSFFPQLVAGPIVRATELGPQLQTVPGERLIESSLAFRLILLGLFKKVVISSYLATEIVDPVFGLPEEHSSLEIAFALYAYAIQIYADFSGYTDIAIGCALLLGLRLPKNFDSPYRATSVQDFWRRWHMTLSRWLRDYLYFPLGGSRGSRIFTYRNLMLTMVLGGLWHGAAWTFVLWGTVIGVALIVERAFRESGWGARIWAGLPVRARPILGWALTFHVITLAWLFFRAESVEVAFDMLGRLFTAGGGSPLVTPLLVAVIAGSILAQFIPEGFTLRMQAYFSRLPAIPQAAALGVGFFLIDRLGPEGVAPFIYFQF